VKIKLTLEYSGGAFSGWQFQPGMLTVQGELERALGVYLQGLAKKQGLTLSELPRVSGASRTDAGVHARGQVASFPWPLELPYDGARLVMALNAISHHDVGVLNAQETDDSFDARFSPHYKCYQYYLLLRPGGGDGLERGRAWRLGQPLRIKEMIGAARSLCGTHDFSAFRAADCSAKTTVRTLFLSELSRRSGDLLVYSVLGNGFLKQMVRTIVGTLVEVGLGKRRPEDIAALLSARDRSLAGETAPAWGLVLEWVRYSAESLPQKRTF
jgi:tRNA pseudouridine38-40 synthase